MGNTHNDNNDDFDKLLASLDGPPSADELLPSRDGLPSADELDDAEAERLFAAVENGIPGALAAIETLNRKRHEEAVARGDVEQPAPWRVLPPIEREPTPRSYSVDVGNRQTTGPGDQALVPVHTVEGGLRLLKAPDELLAYERQHEGFRSVWDQYGHVRFVPEPGRVTQWP